MTSNTTSETNSDTTQFVGDWQSNLTPSTLTVGKTYMLTYSLSNQSSSFNLDLGADIMFDGGTTSTHLKSLTNRTMLTEYENPDSYNWTVSQDQFNWRYNISGDDGLSLLSLSYSDDTLHGVTTVSKKFYLEMPDGNSTRQVESGRANDTALSSQLLSLTSQDYGKNIAPATTSVLLRPSSSSEPVSLASADSISGIEFLSLSTNKSSPTLIPTSNDPQTSVASLNPSTNTDPPDVPVSKDSQIYVASLTPSISLNSPPISYVSEYRTSTYPPASQYQSTKSSSIDTSQVISSAATVSSYSDPQQSIKLSRSSSLVGPSATNAMTRTVFSLITVTIPSATQTSFVDRFILVPESAPTVLFVSPAPIPTPTNPSLSTPFGLLPLNPFIASSCSDSSSWKSTASLILLSLLSSLLTLKLIFKLILKLKKLRIRRQLSKLRPLLRQMRQSRRLRRSPTWNLENHSTSPDVFPSDDAPPRYSDVISSFWQDLWAVQGEKELEKQLRLRKMGDGGDCGGGERPRAGNNDSSTSQQKAS